MKKKKAGKKKVVTGYLIRAMAPTDWGPYHGRFWFHENRNDHMATLDWVKNVADYYTDVRVSRIVKWVDA